MKLIWTTQFWLFLLFCSYLSLTSAPPSMMQTVSDKLLHAAGYLALYLSCSAAYPLTRHIRYRLIALLSYSILIEVIQHFIPNRGFSVYDIAANGLGLMLGTIAFHLFQKRF